MAYIGVVVVVWLVSGVAGFVIAEGKGRNPWGWAGLCLFFGLVAVLIVSVLPAESPNQLVVSGYAPPVGTVAMTADLQALASMHQRGALTDAEFLAAKTRVLGEARFMPATASVVGLPPVAGVSPEAGVAAHVEARIQCESCGTRNRPNRSDCWSCQHALPASVSVVG